MKKCLLSIFFVFTVSCLFAQANNPKNQDGINYVKSLKSTIEMYKQGTINDINEKTLALVQKNIPLKTEINVNLATGIIQTYKEKNINLNTLIKNSKQSENAKELAVKISTIPSGSEFDITNYYSTITDNIALAKISEEEKSMLYSLNAVVYNVLLSDIKTGFLSRDSGGGGCDIVGPEGSGSAGATACVALGAMAGFYMGFQACGFWCGLGGAVIVGVAVAIAVC